MIRLLSIFRKPLHPEARRNLFVWGRVDHTPVRAHSLMSIDPSEGLKQFKRVHGPMELSISHAEHRVAPTPHIPKVFSPIHNVTAIIPTNRFFSKPIRSDIQAVLPPILNSCCSNAEKL